MSSEHSERVAKIIFMQSISTTTFHSARPSLRPSFFDATDILYWIHRTNSSALSTSKVLKGRTTSKRILSCESVMAGAFSRT